ncbi:MAG: methylated-DNA--[protein]-cysteine S-methyltransferase, partial [Alphaproteobacteria bacterium]|nr:methylated-DNA--[protein]-cysteine S-methyltransferase [Alphaproteobacteria bacterium]
GLDVRYGFHSTPFGRALLLSSPRGLLGLSFVTESGDTAALREQAARWPMAAIVHDPRTTAPVAERIFAEAGNGRGPAGGPPLAALVPGTNFQIKVWEALLSVPEGSLVSYNHLGALIGNPGAARAIGNALAANPLAYLIPCHRVIRATGAFNDYRWGTGRKLSMIAWEAARTAPANPGAHDQ